MFLKHKPRGFLEAVLAGTMIRKLSATSRAGTIREHNNQGKTVQHAECESGSFCCTLEHGKNKERDRDLQNGWGPCQLHPGTHVVCSGCFLPDLTW